METSVTAEGHPLTSRAVTTCQSRLMLVFPLGPVDGFDDDEAEGESDE